MNKHPNDQKVLSAFGLTVLIVLPLYLFGGCFGLPMGPMHTSHEERSAQEFRQKRLIEAERKNSDSDMVGSGSVYRITQRMFVANSIYALEEMMKAVEAKDEFGMQQLLDKSQVSVVTADCKVRVLGIAQNESSVELRVLSGPNKDKKAYTRVEFLKLQQKELQ